MFYVVCCMQKERGKNNTSTTLKYLAYYQAFSQFAFSMTTRAASVANSRRAKQQLVNLLFKADLGGQGRDAHRKLDFASYTYNDLRNAYLTKIKNIHPDKVMHQRRDLPISHNDNKDSILSDPATFTTRTDDQWNESTVEMNSDWDDIINTSTPKKKSHEEFVELQAAWDAYEKIAKALQRGQSDSDIRGVQENFTRFGVGCSFSDNIEESHRRAEIMDQACQGWCSAGQLSESSSSEIEQNREALSNDMQSNGDRNSNEKMSLIDDEMFEIQEGNRIRHQNSNRTSKARSLIDHMMNKSR